MAVSQSSGARPSFGNPAYFHVVKASTGPFTGQRQLTKKEPLLLQERQMKNICL